MANPEHVEIAKRGADAIEEWRGQHPDERLDLSGADLSRVDLREADLPGADLNRAILPGAILVGANLRSVNLAGANLREAWLSAADLRSADLSNADALNCDLFDSHLADATLTGSRLCGAALGMAILTRAALRGADTSDAIWGYTTLGDCDLSSVRGLETVQHIGPNAIGVDTLVRTLEGAGGLFTAEQRTFFEASGVSRTLLHYLPDLLETQPIQFFSCFISYGAEDGEFAQRLYDDLRGRSIRCWKYDVDAIVGRDVWANISRAIVVHEKMIVVCSKSSLQRAGVQGEIERVLQKEEQLKRRQTEKGHEDIDTDVLVPVRLDDYVLHEWDHPRAADVRKKHMGDFRGWDKGRKNYKRGMEQLLRALDPRSKLGLSKGDLRELAQD